MVGPDTLEAAERELADDLRQDLERFSKAAFAADVYRALSSNVWAKGEARVALSWRRAEELVNALRVENGHEPLELAQSGDEGEVSQWAEEFLAELGWQLERPLDQDGNDPLHLASAEDPPPRGQGEREAPVGDSAEWERRAQEEASASRRGQA